MVYKGPSQGCGWCKRQRKKCDETRPSCMRCMRAKRVCTGYEDGAVSAFRLYEYKGTTQKSSFVSAARKCSLPKRMPLPGTGIVPEDDLHRTIPRTEIDAFALRAFFYDFCVIFNNSNISRGYLSGVEQMTRRLGPSSTVVKACQAVVYASHAKPLHRPELSTRADTLYQELLGDLTMAIDGPTWPSNAEVRLVAMLAGLYQMVTSNEKAFGDHNVHAKGLAALMSIEELPFSLLRPARSSHVPVQFNGAHVKKLAGVFDTPSLKDHGTALDDLLLYLDSLWSKYQSSPSDLYIIEHEAKTLEERFASWQNSRVAEFKPTVIGSVTSTDDEVEIVVGCWPGKVDTYLDLYVSGVWNIFRVARLLLICLRLKIFDDIGCLQSAELIQLGFSIAKDMIASIPYHLTDNLQSFVNNLASTKDIDPGRSLGGLLLMHPLYVASQIPFLPEEMRHYMRQCLEWIAANLGLAQAELLAKTPDMDRNYLASGCLIVWYGFLG